MPSNSFGDLFTVTTWGESHGESIGAVIDGCPPNIDLCPDCIYSELQNRKPKESLFTTPRKEKDYPQILSGVLDNKTTGTPISILIPNEDVDSSPYKEAEGLLRPSHSNYTYKTKYGLVDERGGGRASARETASRVAAGAVAKKIVQLHNIEILAYVSSIGDVDISSGVDKLSFAEIKALKYKSPLFCPDPMAEKKMICLLNEIKEQKDSIGGKVTFISTPLPPGLGDPIFDKLSANLAKAFISIPACIAISIGIGCLGAKMKGSDYNDLFDYVDGKIITKTNHCGGILGGISSGMPLQISLFFKPTPTIAKAQETINFKGDKRSLELKKSRHDLCVAIRACAVVEAMGGIVLANAILKQRSLS